MITLIVILTLASTLFSITAYSFLGFYNGFTNYVGEGKDVIAVYSKSGSTPYSGVIPIDLANNISILSGVIAVSPETIALCTVNDQAVFIRGILPADLSQLNRLQMLNGQALLINDTDSTMVGQSLSHRLNLKTGDRFLAFSVLSKTYVELQVKGIFQSDSSLDDEALVPLYVGQWLRGIGYTDATLIRAKIDPSQTNTEQIYQRITNQFPKPSTSTSPSPTSRNQAQEEFGALIPLIPTYINIGDIGVERSQQFMQSYLDRFGVSKDALIILSASVLVFASGTAFVALSLFVRQHSNEISILRSIGVSAKKVKMDLTIRTVIWALVATLMGTAISALVLFIFQGLGYLQVLSHSISFQLDPLIFFANFALLSVLIGISIARTELKQ
jgi:ABC-type lipoprotein release transport system permease subunit